MNAPTRPTIPIAAADDLGRRRFLKLVAASAALAGAGCKGPPAETIVPYVDMPEREVPGQPLFYASAFVRRGVAHGVLVETNGGRPTKVEGNPDHPVDAGATDVFMQASILQMWDPDRSQVVQQGAELSTWPAFEAALAARRARFDKDGGAGLRILIGPSSSPTMARQLAGLLERYPNARWIAYDPLHDDGACAATRLAFGRPLDAVYRLDKVDVLLTLDADLFGAGPGAIAHARAFTASRRLGANAAAGKGMNRLYALESTPTITGAYADERLARAPQAIEAALWRIAGRLDKGLLNTVPDDGGAADPVDARWEASVAKALRAAQGRALVVAGPTLGPQSRALVHLINQKLGAEGSAVSYIEPVLLGAPDHLDAIAALAGEMHAGRVDTLLMLDTNPVYSAPADLRFAEGLKRVPFSAHLGLYRDETARAAAWHLPLAHNYEAWSDARAHDGTASIVQPLIAPLYEGRSVHAVLALLDEGGTRDGHAIVRATWRQGQDGRDEKSNAGARYGMDIGTNPATSEDPAFDRRWQDTLRRGLAEGSAAKPVAVGRANLPTRPAQAEPAPLVVLFARDPAVDAGEFANNGWLQELPRPLTSLTWDNAALIGPRTAAAAHLRTGDRVRLHAASDGASQPGRGGLVVPLLVMEEHAEGVITLPLGYGRTSAGGVGTGIGFDAYPLRTRAAWSAPLPVRMERAAGRHDFVLRQHEVDMMGRPIVEVSELEGLEGRLATGAGHEPPQPTLYPEHKNDPDSYRWGMAIDLNACIGCGTCTIACQAENNIPVVGKEEVARGRIMHWIRVDRYRVGTGAKRRTLFQPVPCMHCEHAPCEEVCPVGATMHDEEGLNVQVYNRCVGTRFCSNNCPYKVRRFNFLQYSNEKVESLKALQNPEVTVRRRGVMEKCTFCLQRITRARIDAEKRGSRIADGELVTACQQACPTSAIRFGDLNDPRADVVAAKAARLDYVLLEELNTRPRTSYTTRVLNPDGELG